MVIDRSSPIPLYFQLKRILLEKIQRGEWKHGELIPGEHELEDTYQLSRTTVRQTLNELVIEGYLVRQRGRGTFIAQPKVAFDPAKRLELNEYMEQQGYVLGWRLIDQQMIPAPLFVTLALDLPEGAPVLCLRRQRLASEEVIGYHTAYLPQAYTDHVDPELICVGESLHYIHTLAALKDARLERTLHATLSDKADAEFLKLGKNAPVLHMERRVLATNDTPIEYMVARFSGERFKYRFIS
ncbi:MAG TPA: GntR family transcriptional regulator [Phototrophicaceae bacterium]|jgi:GntR family transcriptional regulator|nr:GntR family transcriptional regulator [Phototrophicaceae bacterium]